MSDENVYAHIDLDGPGWSNATTDEMRDAIERVRTGRIMVCINGWERRDATDALYELLRRLRWSLDHAFEGTGEYWEDYASYCMLRDGLQAFATATSDRGAPT